MKRIMLIISTLLFANIFTIGTLFAKQNNNLIKINIYSPSEYRYIVVFSNDKNKSFCLLEFQDKKIEVFTVKNNKKYVKIYFKNNKAIGGQMGHVGVSDFNSTSRLIKSDKIIMLAYTAKLRHLIKKYKIFEIIDTFKKQEIDKKRKKLQKKWDSALTMLKEI